MNPVSWTIKSKFKMKHCAERDAGGTVRTRPPSQDWEQRPQGCGGLLILAQHSAGDGAQGRWVAGLETRGCAHHGRGSPARGLVQATLRERRPSGVWYASRLGSDIQTCSAVAERAEQRQLWCWPSSATWMAALPLAGGNYPSLMF
jgi:hypothetical protein